MSFLTKNVFSLKKDPLSVFRYRFVSTDPRSIVFHLHWRCFLAAGQSAYSSRHHTNHTHSPTVFFLIALDLFNITTVIFCSKKMYPSLDIIRYKEKKSFLSLFLNFTEAANFKGLWKKSVFVIDSGVWDCHIKFKLFYWSSVKWVGTVHFIHHFIVKLKKWWVILLLKHHFGC